MSISLVLIAIMVVLYACGIYLLLERSMTRVLLGFLLVGNATNLLLITMVGEVGVAPIVEDGVSAAEMTDPMPEALIYRSWRLEQDDDLDDDEADIAMRSATVAEIGESLESTTEDTEFGGSVPVPVDRGEDAR
jgi:multicomponent Na+:H+ antiporter subunit C